MIRVRPRQSANLKTSCGSASAGGRVRRPHISDADPHGKGHLRGTIFCLTSLGELAGLVLMSAVVLDRTRFIARPQQGRHVAAMRPVAKSPWTPVMHNR